MNTPVSYTTLSYVVIAAAVVVDMLIIPFWGPYPWFPSLALAFAPAAFLVFGKVPAGIYTTALVLLVWLASGINLGIAVFSVGIALLAVRSGVPALLQYETWQTAVAASFGVILFGGCVALATALLVPTQTLLLSTFVISMILTALVSIPLTVLIQKTK